MPRAFRFHETPFRVTSRSLAEAVGRKAFAALLVLSPISAVAQPPEAQGSVVQLKKLSLEELSDLRVTSVSRVEEPLGVAPAAVSVVTNEDLRRSGATTIPAALRLVPGLHVARATSSSWVVSARGFSSVNSEKLLVQSDTRSIYTPLYSGVLWDVQNYLLQDVDRIEVIRGPGATQWGSNAVNGVINITTKSAKDTQGSYFEAIGGTAEHASVAARYGGTLGKNGHYRVFGRMFDRDGTFNTTPLTDDDWRLGHGGFRADWTVGSRDAITVQGDVYRGTIGQLAPATRIEGRPGPEGDLEAKVAGGNVLARWRRATSPGSEFQVRGYYDRTHRNDPTFVDDLHTVDVDVQHRRPLPFRQQLTWGANYRFMSNRNVSKSVFAIDPASAGDHLVSGFVQSQIRVTEAFRVTLGTKLEHNDFSGGEVQPSARVSWELSPSNHIWAAASRAVRVPTRLERDIAIDVTNPAGNPLVRLLGDKDFDSERLVAYEVGYRWRALPSVFVDLATFYNDYAGLASLEVIAPFTDDTGRTIIPVVNRNLTDGHARGLEALVTITPTPWWRLSVSSSTIDLNLDPAGQDRNRGAWYDGATPRHQLGIQFFIDLPSAWQLDARFRHHTAIRRVPVISTGEGFPEYAQLDLRLAWRGWRQMELSLVGQNLLHDRTTEFGFSSVRAGIERGVYGKVAWGF